MTRLILKILLVLSLPAFLFGCKMRAATPRTVRISDAPTNSAFAYDSKIISAVQQHWYVLLDAEPGLLPKKKGEVTVIFRLYPDGHVSDLRSARRTTDEKTALTCQQAILEAAPFAPWPLEVQHAATNGFRDVHFTFQVTP